MDKADQVLNFKPNEQFVKAFNDLAGGYSHSFRYDHEKDKIFFSALTHNCDIIQIYSDSTDEMQRKFIDIVNSKVKEND